jgi:hypothetical protein
LLKNGPKFVLHPHFFVGMNDIEMGQIKMGQIKMAPIARFKAEDD